MESNLGDGGVGEPVQPVGARWTGVREIPRPEIPRPGLSGSPRTVILDGTEETWEQAKINGIVGGIALAAVTGGAILSAIRLSFIGVAGAVKVHMGKQGKHIVGHLNYEPGRSILRADPGKLAKRAGTGTPVNKVPRGQAGFKERVQFDDVIGDLVNKGVVTPRGTGSLLMQNGSIHIIPTAP